MDSKLWEYLKKENCIFRGTSWWGTWSRRAEHSTHGQDWRQKAKKAGGKTGQESPERGDKTTSWSNELVLYILAFFPFANCILRHWNVGFLTNVQCRVNWTVEWERCDLIYLHTSDVPQCWVWNLFKHRWRWRRGRRGRGCRNWESRKNVRMRRGNDWWNRNRSVSSSTGKHY